MGGVVQVAKKDHTMPQNCTAVKLKDVIKFFIEDIDGMGKHDGHPRNLDTPASLKMYEEWKLCELTKEEFLHLIIPDRTNTLIKDKNLGDVEGAGSIDTVQRYLKKLKNNANIPHLIVRNKLLNDSPRGSYYIEDGAHRAIAAKIYFQNNSYISVKAYIGTKKGVTKGFGDGPEKDCCSKLKMRHFDLSSSTLGLFENYPRGFW